MHLHLSSFVWYAAQTFSWSGLTDRIYVHHLYAFWRAFTPVIFTIGKLSNQTKHMKWPGVNRPTSSDTNPHPLEMKQSTLLLIKYNEDLLWKAFPLQEIFHTALHNSPVQDLLHYILFLIWGSSLIIFMVLVLLSHGLFLMSFLWASVTWVAPWSGEENVPTEKKNNIRLLKQP